MLYLAHHYRSQNVDGNQPFDEPTGASSNLDCFGRKAAVHPHKRGAQLFENRNAKRKIQRHLVHTSKYLRVTPETRDRSGAIPPVDK